MFVLPLAKVWKFLRKSGAGQGQHYFKYVRASDNAEFPSLKKAKEAGFEDVTTSPPTSQSSQDLSAQEPPSLNQSGVQIRAPPSEAWTSRERAS